jgi:hypothetical protein
MGRKLYVCWYFCLPGLDDVLSGLLLEKPTASYMQDTGVKVAPKTKVTIIPDYRERMEGEEERRKQEGKNG